MVGRKRRQAFRESRKLSNSLFYLHCIYSSLVAETCAACEPAALALARQHHFRSRRDLDWVFSTLTNELGQHARFVSYYLPFDIFREQSPTNRPGDAAFKCLGFAYPNDQALFSRPARSDIRPREPLLDKSLNVHSNTQFSSTESEAWVVNG